MEPVVGGIVTAGTLVTLAAVTLGDAAIAAFVAGTFSTVNLVLNALILRKAGEAKSEATSARQEARRAALTPRRFLYDSTGNVIGSVPEDPRGELTDFQPMRDGENIRWHERGSGE